MKVIRVLFFIVLGMSWTHFASAKVAEAVFKCKAEKIRITDEGFETIATAEGNLNVSEEYGVSLEIKMAGYNLSAMAVKDGPLDILRVDIRNAESLTQTPGSIGMASLASNMVSTTLFASETDMVTFTCRR